MSKLEDRLWKLKNLLDGVPEDISRSLRPYEWLAAGGALVSGDLRGIADLSFSDVILECRINENCGTLGGLPPD